mmetsp:Transcript_12957/g.52133  ORF Transcript_12957/g.52133 Transcript_12957/m.52133 type:complete len:216 (-) Transcript_12957:4095-4742(-)
MAPRLSVTGSSRRCSCRAPSTCSSPPTRCSPLSRACSPTDSTSGTWCSTRRRGSRTTAHSSLRRFAASAPPRASCSPVRPFRTTSTSSAPSSQSSSRMSSRLPARRRWRLTPTPPLGTTALCPPRELFCSPSCSAAPRPRCSPRICPRRPRRSSGCPSPMRRGSGTRPYSRVRRVCLESSRRPTPPPRRVRLTRACASPRRRRRRPGSVVRSSPS